MSVKREFLKRKTTELVEEVKQGKYSSINNALVSLYEKHGYKNLKSFKAWQKQGYRIKKGAEAVYIWSKKIEIEIEENGIKKAISFCPLLPVFSELQVYKSNN